MATSDFIPVRWSCQDIYPQCAKVNIVIMKSNDEYYFGSPLNVPGEPLRDSQPSPRPAKKQRRFPVKKLLLGLLLITALAAAGFGGWKLFSNRNAPVLHESNTPEQPVAPEAEASHTEDDIPEAKEIKTFKAARPRISFDYPSEWTITENDSGVRVESPGFKYTASDGSPVDGNFRVYVRQQARPADSVYIGQGIAIESSKKFIYSQPVVGQLPETNMIYFGLDSTKHFAYFFVAGNFALEKGDILGPDYGKEPETYIITGGYSAKDQEDDMATHPVPLEYYASTNAFKQAMDIIKSLKLL